MWQLLASVTLLSAALDVRVETLDAKTLTGSLVDVQSETITLSVNGRQETLAVSDLLNVVVSKKGGGAEEEPSVWIELLGESQLAASQIQQSSGTGSDNVTVTHVGGQRVDFPTRSIRWIRFRSPQQSVQQQWNSILRQRMTGDLLVYRLPGDNLDFLEGTVMQLDPGSVGFRFDNEAVQVPRDRLEGIVYYTPTVEELPEAVCQVRDTRGSLWNAAGMRLADGKLQVETTAGVTVVLPLDYVEKIDFAAGNIVYLSDLEPQMVSWTPYLPSAAVSQQLSQLFQPRRDQSFGGGKLRLHFSENASRTEEFNKGLAIYSRTELIYRLPEGFQRLTALAGIDERVRDAGSVVLDISGDGTSLLNKTITGRDEPLWINVPIEGVRRIRILVDFADDLAMADQLDLCNARITK